MSPFTGLTATPHELASGMLAITFGRAGAGAFEAAAAPAGTARARTPITAGTTDHKTRRVIRPSLRRRRLSRPSHAKRHSRTGTAKADFTPVLSRASLLPSTLLNLLRGGRRRLDDR